MSDDYLPLGFAPAEEEPAQFGSPDYPDRSRIECRVFRRMLLRLFPPPLGADVSVIVKEFPYEFDFYREVCVRFGADRRGVEYAFMLEHSAPIQWDEIARAELAWYERRRVYRCAVEAGDLTWEQVPEAYRDHHPPENLLALEYAAVDRAVPSEGFAPTMTPSNAAPVNISKLSGDSDATEL